MNITLAVVSFKDIFPSFEDQIQTLHNLLIPVAAVLMIAGLLSALRYAYTPRSMMRALMVSVLITATLALWSQWLTLIQDSLSSLVDEMDASPQNTADRYSQLLIERQSESEDSLSLFNFQFSSLSDIIVTGFLQLIGIIASFFIWIAYIIQQFFLGFSYALAPIFLGMLALRSTGSIGVRFVMSTIGLLFWPLGWAAASIGTSNLIDIFTRQELAAFGPVYSQQSILGAGIIGLWIIVSTLIAPVIIQVVISSGANAGAALASGGLTATADAAKAGIGAAATIAVTGGAGAGIAALGVGLAAAGSSAAGSSMRGGGGGLSGQSLQSLIPKLQHASSGSGGSSSSSGPSKGSATSSSSSATSAQFSESSPINDITGDESAAKVIEQSRSKS